MAATTLFSSPISHQHHHQHQYPISIQQFPSCGANNILLQPVTTRSPLILIRASSSPSTVDKQEKDDDDDEQQESSSSSSNSFTQPISSIPLGGCKSCGKAEIERGCNGEGRIQGGIATVPGFGWWPIKAYRPCPGFVATGGRYRRQGQSMDEVAGFGTVPITSPSTTTSASASSGETESSQKKQGPRKFKR